MDFYLRGEIVKKEDYFMLCSKSRRALSISKLCIAFGFTFLAVGVAGFLTIDIITAPILTAIVAITGGLTITGVVSLAKHYQFEDKKLKLKEKQNEEIEQSNVQVENTYAGINNEKQVTNKLTPKEYLEKVRAWLIGTGDKIGTALGFYGEEQAQEHSTLDVQGRVLKFRDPKDKEDK
jgi:hypothetical protein